MIQLKIKKDDHLTKYISLIRKYDPSLSIADIKTRIERSEYVIEHDFVPKYDFCDEISGVDRNVLFRELISKLLSYGAQIEILKNGSVISVEYLDNRIATAKEIEKEILLDIDRELGER